MSRAEVHAALGAPANTTEKGASTGLTDIYGHTAVFVYYDKAHTCQAIEFWEDPLEVPELDGVVLVGIPYRDAHRWIAQRDQGVEEEDAGLTSHALGVALYADGAGKDPDTEVESLLVFRRGYYVERP
jgi:hypothetical protein